MEKLSKEHLVNDIENRLDDFFDDSDTGPSSAKSTVSMEKLKSVVLSIDWEITEACLSDLINETDALLPHYHDDRLTHSLLRMLRALGRYIRQHKAQAHPDAIKRVMSVFAALEQLTSSPQMPADQRKAIVAREIGAFKKLKQHVDSQHKPAKKSPEPAGEEAADFVNQHKLDQVLNDVEQRMNAQVTALKKQLADLQKELNTIRPR